MGRRVPDLTAAEAAARLGIKPETLYAYVSRGLLNRTRDAEGSWFDPLDVEEFARRRRPAAGSVRSARAAGHPAGTPLMTIEHDITLLEDDRLSFRGRDATELADTTSFETVCWWLWTRDWDPHRRFTATANGAAAAAARAALPEAMTLRERMQALVPVLAATDPLRHDLSGDSVARMGAEIIAGVVDGLSAPAAGPAGAGIAGRLCALLTDGPADENVVRLVDATLVLLVDHDLAASTLAVRAAASARANPYAVVCCGLGALDSALHGNAGRHAYRMVADVVAGRPVADVLAAAVASYGRVPGFGHRVYRTTDPRWVFLIDRLRALVPEAPALMAADDLVTTVQARISIFPNVDLALSVLALALELEPEATELVFAVARCGGWIAHALGEYAEPPLRLRPEGRYVGP
ncbi:MAG TPA: citrate synthase [Microlunatus sp.]|nr:citrate synthase [Microlunatus sp.]